MPVYADDGIETAAVPELLRLMNDKSCYPIKRLAPPHRR